MRVIREEQAFSFDQLKQSAEEIEQCSGCYANPTANSQADLQGLCVQPRRQMNACGKSLQ